MKQLAEIRSTDTASDKPLLILGWREWAALPELGIKRIKCKVDTGARTSALHTFYVERFNEDGCARVRFGVHPKQGRSEAEVHCTADLLDERKVTDSGGHSEQRYVIQTLVTLFGQTWPIEVSLTSRDNMKFRMLLGRTAIRNRFLVNPALSYRGETSNRRR